MGIITGNELKILRRTVFFFVLMAALAIMLWGLQVDRARLEMILGRAALLGLLMLLYWDQLRGTGPDRQKISPGIILASITTGVLVSLATRWYQLTVYKYGLLVTPGAGQINPGAYNTTSAELLLLVALVVCLGPALEEFVFRFLGLGMAVRRKWPGPLFVPWLLALSALFAMLHQPD